MSHQLCVAFGCLIIASTITLVGIRFANSNPEQPLITLESHTSCNCQK